MPASVAEILGPGGALAEVLAGYEVRPQQLRMAELVEAAIAKPEHAIIEAPTGVGKSFAYLVPAALHALSANTQVVVSTGTIALQEQLIDKDLPLLQKILPEAQAVLVKGRQNYLCLNRLAYTMSSRRALFDDREQARELKEVAAWANTTQAGDLRDLGYTPSVGVWTRINSNPDSCRGRRCELHGQCFFQEARRRMEHARILVVNHHLYFSDLALRNGQGGILPPHRVLIFDEAHSLEDVATDHLGTTVSQAQVRFYLDGLWSSKSKGMLAEEAFAAARAAVIAAREANDSLWAGLSDLLAPKQVDLLRLSGPEAVPNPLSPALDQVAEALLALTGRCPDDNTLAEVKAQRERACVLAGSLRTVLAQELPEHVYYGQVPTRSRGTPSLAMHPLSVAKLLQEQLFSRLSTVILTSATLAADDSERFLFFRRRIGLEGGLAARLDSPFDHARQAELLVNESELDPNSPVFERAFGIWLGDYVEKAQGGVFVLFTSYRQLQAVHDLVHDRLDRAKRFVLKQGDRIGRSQMLDLFKSTGNAILFGTSSFWEGVDVRGDALRHVIITKLPFEVPDHPLVEARHQDITRRGGDPFMERSIPEAILRLKQGTGRLIRTRTDTGAIVIADHRVLTRRYGRYFVRALPPMPLKRFKLADWITAG